MSEINHQPSLRDLINLDIPTSIKISPDGRSVAVTVRKANWKDNRYETVCMIRDVETGAWFPINQTGNVQQVEWVDEHSLAILKGGFEENEKPQIWYYDHLIGDSLQVTDHEEGIERFEPYLGGFLFLANDPERAKKKERSEKYGKFTYFEKEESASALYYVGLKEWLDYQQQVLRSNEEEEKSLVKPVVELSKLIPESLKIENMIPGPKRYQIYINCRSKDDLVHYQETNSYQITFDPESTLAEFLQQEKDKKAEEEEKSQKKNEDQKEDFAYLGKITPLNLPKQAKIAEVSPNVDRLLIAYPERDRKMFTQSDLWVIPVDKAVVATDEDEFLQSLKIVTAAFDHDVMLVIWQSDGIFVSYVDGQVMKIACFDDSGQFDEVEFGGIFPYTVYEAFDVSDNGRLAMIGANETRFQEVYIATPPKVGNLWSTQILTNFAENLKDWNLGTVETLRWTSKDGAEIEGVLRKPKDFDSNKKYPLAFVVHGGPRWVSPLYLLTISDMNYYPSIQLINKDVLILYPNYRGSEGRGQAFLELNKDNLGVGDLWDLESAIDYLDHLGLIDPERVGCMGWSQGGYISAFAGTHSDKFTAVSIGAGISDWYTYHISNDIPNFTVDYLSVSPFRDRKLYDLTAPIQKLSEQSAPALIQHGSEDRRVPLSNAMEMYRGLQEMGVHTELFVYPGMGHPITKPRENHAVMHQNLAWFSHYLLGENLELF